jgi:hypothetical protein
MFVGATKTKTLSPLRGLYCMVESLPGVYTPVYDLSPLRGLCLNKTFYQGVTLLSVIYHFFGFDVSEHSARGLQKVPHDYYLNSFYLDPENRIISCFLYYSMLNSVKIL